MEAVALIVEYNPLHNGHVHHLAEAKKIFPNAVIIAILNGDFLQRGEPALLSKYERTRLALLAGVDLVLELPFAYGTQRADIFARGAITIARGFAAHAFVYGTERLATDDTPLDALGPNEKLAYFYKRIAQEPGRTITPIAITRMKAPYNATTITDAHFASASALRTKILHDDFTDLQHYVPRYVLDTIEKNRRHFADISNYFPYLQYTLTRTQCPHTALAQFGLAESIDKALTMAATFDEFFAHVHHKHTSKTHIKRTLTYRLTNTKQLALDAAIQTPWTRVLGASLQGKKYLKYLKVSEQLNIQLIAKINDLPKPHYNLQYNSLIAYAQLSHTAINTALTRENSNNIIQL
jgi:predicted nucleotidyltransferase